MSVDRTRIERVRQVIAACGGWNRRSRGALLAWARAEGVDDAQLERLLAEALAMRTPRPVDASTAPAKSEGAPARAAGSRWWLAALAGVGLAASALLVLRLAPRIDAARVAPKPVAPAPAPAAVEPSRTLPPAPVSFPTPPEIQAPPVSTQAIAPRPLGERPAGELARTSVQAWRDTYAAIAHAWPTLPAAERDATIESLADWVAMGSAADLAALRAAQRQAAERMEVTDRTLAAALDAMLAAQVAVNPRISSAVAADPAFASAGRVDAARALGAWAAAQVPQLVSGLGAPDARQRWAAWLQAVGAIASERERTSIALAAIDAMLRGDARLDGQGIAADALGSLLAGIPARPDQSGFGAVRDAWVAWLRDARVPSARLWALGGIWRSRGEAPDAWLLPGERDGAQARTELAERWSRLAAAQAAPRWQSLLAELGRPVPRSADTRLETRLDDLAARVGLLRRAESPALAIDPVQPPSPRADAPAPREVEARWAKDLASPVADTRQSALRDMRAEAPDSLGVEAASALAARAIGAQSREERALAQEIVRGSLAENSAMREAIAREVALCADPRVAADFLERLLARDLPSDEANAMRAAALAGLLAAAPTLDEAVEASAALRRLCEQVAAWSGLTPEEDPASAAWALAARACAEAAALHPPAVVQPLVAGLADRARRLSRLAPDGPRGFAAALSLLCDARAARIAVLRSADADSLRRIADAAALARSRGSDAIVQAAASLDALAAMQLLADGAPVPVPSVEIAGGAAPGPSARLAAQAELARAEAMLESASIDTRRLAAPLRHAVSLDGSVAGSAALAMAQGCTSSWRRDRWLEAAALLGQGAALPTSAAPDAADGIALAQVMAWCQRAQLDRLDATRLNDRVRGALERHAAATDSTVEVCLAGLREATPAQRARAVAGLRAAALHALDRASAGWLGAIAAGDAAPIPEADPAQPWRFMIPEG